MRVLTSGLLVSIVMVTIAAGCDRARPTSTPRSIEPGAGGGAGPGGRPLLAPEPTPGVRFRLGDAEAGAEAAAEPIPPVAGEPLTEDEVGTLLERLPALPAAAAERVSFALRPGPRPPAVTGDTIRAPFPPEAAAGPPPAVAAGPLEVARYQPEGDVETMPRLAVTFSQPMVPLTSHAALATAEVPVTLEPQPPGQWRWAGSQTLIFEPEGGRFPMATEYRVTAAAGIKSAAGAALAEAKSWTFRTPPPKMVASYPRDDDRGSDAGTTVREPVIFVQFDQKVDAGAVLPRIKATAGGAAAELRLATAAEVEADATVKDMVEDAVEGRWVALRPAAPLPYDSAVTVAIGPELPSAEGPRTTAAAESFSFRTYGPLKVERVTCGGMRENVLGILRTASASDCEPLAPWAITFSNELDMGAFDPATVTVEPEVPGQRIEANGNAIVVSGASKGRTTYTVRLPATLRDAFGQTLDEEVTVTFQTGDMPSALFAPGDDMVVLDPAGGPTFTAYSVNNDSLNVRLFKVGPQDWRAYQDARWRQNDENPPGPPGEQVWSGAVTPEAKRDEIAGVPIDLTPALADGLGQVLVIVEPAEWSWRDDNYANRPQWRWVQATKLGIAAFTERGRALAWVSALADGRPVSGAAVSRVPGGEPATTGADGLAALPLADAESAEGREGMVLVAAKDGDLALLTGGFWGYPGTGTPLTWYVFEDRGLYKPGEEVRFKGWLRYVGMEKGGDVEAFSGKPGTVDYALTAPNGEEIAKGSLAVGPSGGFGGVLALPADVELGYANLQLTAKDGEEVAGQSGRQINIAEFRRPEFEVTAASDAPYYFIGDRGAVTAKAAYYAGGPLPSAETNWYVSATPTNFTPPGRDDFHFGAWRPIWVFWDSGPGHETDSTGNHTGRTDATGQHRLAIDFDGVYPLSAVSFRAEASVMDVNRQAWTGNASFLVHPAREYVGLRADRWFVEAGESLAIETIVADIDGRLVAGRDIKLRAERVESKWQGDKYVEELVPAGDCAATSADDPQTCDFRLDQGGMYRLTAEIADADGRPNMSQLTVWVAGAPTAPRRGVEQEQVQLIPSADAFQPGDTAEILVQAPFAPAEGLLSIRRSGLVRTEPIHLDEPSTVLRVPIDESLMPNFTVQVDLAGGAPRAGPDGQTDENLPKRPAFASGSLDLKVPPRVRTLTVDATPRDAQLQPGGSTTVDVAVTGADGQPLAGADVALVVVDEAVLALTNYQVPDPVEAFYPQRGPDVGDAHQRAYIELADPATLLRDVGAVTPGLPPDIALAVQRLDAPMGRAAAYDLAGSADGQMMQELAPAPAAVLMATAAPSAPRTGGGGEPPAPPVPERANLNPLAAFVPSATTDAGGRVALEVKLPDNVTRYRVTAVATDGGRRFGKGEGTLTARLPLIVRPSAPRFLNFGDDFELPVVVQNQTDQAQAVAVVVRAANLDLSDGFVDAEAGTAAAGRRVTVPANDRVEVRFGVGAEVPGTAVFQAGVFGREAADAQRVTLPVWTPATTEAFATYGQIDEGAIAQPVQRPPDVVEQFGGLELTTSATAVSELTDAFLYLKDYPYEGSEQVASRLIATVALKDVLFAFGGEGLPSADEVEAAVRRDIDKLVALQNSDGGWDWWRREARSWPFTTVHATHALARAKAKGYAVNDESLARAREYLTNIDQHMRALEYSEKVRRTMRAYALYVRTLLDDRDAGGARALFGEAEDHSVEVLGWLLSVLSGDAGAQAEITEIRRRLANAATEEAGTAQFTTGYGEEDGNFLLASDRRADAIVLEALIADQPDSDLIPKVVRGLLDHRKRGRWESTQENAWVLLALDRYFRTYENVTPDFVARAWLGDGFVGEQAFRGRTPDRGQVNVPMSALPAGAATDVVLQKDGAGRLYYRLGLRYAPSDLALEPLERGFSVERAYEAVDDPDDVRRTADGTWEVGAGKRVRVKLTLVVPARRYHVALVDPLPAGLEAVNPELAVSGTVPPAEDEDESGGSWPWWRWWRWYDHEAFRDERTEVFGDLVWEGVYTYTYVARATTPGTFVVPPARAEELYHPETFGRGGTDRVRVR